MKNYSLALVFCLMSTITFAQSKEEKAVATQVESLRKAMVDADKVTLEKLSDEKLSYGHSSGKIEDKASFVSSIVSGKSDFVSIDLTNQTIAVTSSTAIVRHTLSAATNDGGVAGQVKLHILLVWSKEGSQWKLLARQAVKVPA
ncbi:nuclear transport factor 2 family protein [Chitinophaga rhizophila]|uniref:Nuclear transport factor 2 family protein n=1 Tax=Chitinophaga rhizophila TaxID=2866212 RepID=A0ABS7GGY7_9BACT|nr:nuclear transport factor 2 family protein [Chitinophaga rhizophila]MBW8686943.1 nuclear transport factor 2 family protein [Chitinophaga rhizophila]